MTLSDEFWTPKELTEQLRRLGLACSSRSLARWEVRREGPAKTRVGGRTVYRRETVIAWLRSREQQSAPSELKRRGAQVTSTTRAGTS
jgi:hypothetical protein